jgi:23S rRNA pseudouridine2457 synthase
MVIGRLDENSEGLLLLTTDGQLSDTINSRKVEKEYYAQVDGLITSEAIEKLKTGVSIGLHGKKYTTLPGKVEVISIPELPLRAKKIRDKRHGPTSWISIIITEGKFRQIRKMTSAVGFPTLRLVRVRVGDLNINNLAAGEVVELPKLN